MHTHPYQVFELFSGDFSCIEMRLSTGIIYLRGEKHSYTMENHATFSRHNEMKETKEDRRED